MVRQLLPIANACLRGCHVRVARGVRALGVWFEELSNPSVSKARGLKLLRDWLSPEQLAQYDANGYFDVIGCTSGKRYRVCHGTAMNVYEIDLNGEPLTGVCFVPSAPLVAGDVMLAQKIALETNERGALAVAKTFTPTAVAFRHQCLSAQTR
jgi:hypothetical protein